MYKDGEFISCSKTLYTVKKIKYSDNSNNSNYKYLFDDGTYKKYKDNTNIKTKIFNSKMNILKEYKHHPPLGHITILKKDITNKYDFYCIREMHLTKKILSTNKKIFIWGLIKNPNDKYYTIVDE